MWIKRAERLQLANGKYKLFKILRQQKVGQTVTIPVATFQSSNNKVGYYGVVA